MQVKAEKTVSQALLEALTRPQSPPTKLRLAMGCACTQSLWFITK